MKDEEIIARVRAGDGAAARTLLDRYRPILRGRVRRRLRGRVRRRVAESDVIQDTFIAVMNRLDEFEDRGEGSFGRWVNSVLDHKILDQLRRHVVAGRRSVDHEQTSAGAAEAKPAGLATASQRVATDETVRVLHDAMRTLPDDYRRILTLVHFEGLTLDDAALSLERSVDAARKLYGRAVSSLREQIDCREVNDK